MCIARPNQTMIDIAISPLPRLPPLSKLSAPSPLAPWPPPKHPSAANASDPPHRLTLPGNAPPLHSAKPPSVSRAKKTTVCTPALPNTPPRSSPQRKPSLANALSSIPPASLTATRDSKLSPARLTTTRWRKTTLSSTTTAARRSRR